MREWIVCCVSMCGCAGLTPRLVDASVQKPSNVAVYFTVDTRDGEPVPGLTSEQFHIYEDEKPVSPLESKQVILNPEVSAKHYTLLLIDMSGSVTAGGQLPALQEAVNRFTSTVAKYQEMAVYAFDGRQDIVPLRNFGPGAVTVNLSGFQSADPSTNLNGAVIKGIEALEKHLAQSTVPLRFGTLVVFTDGTDHAARATRDQLMNAVRDVNFDVFVIGVGQEIDEAELSTIGKSGVALSRTPTAVGEQFDRIAAKIEGYSKRFYLLSYCSPARAGVHQLTVRPLLQDGRTGDLSYEFNANGFTPNCDPNRKPSFDIRHPRSGKGTKSRGE
jgi:hypothetical protein